MSTLITPGPTAYNNSPTTDPRCIGSTGSLSCPSNALLTDMDLGSADLNTSKVFAWNREVNIVFTFRAETKVNQVNLFFYNIPSSRIGLPPTELYWSIANSILPENLLSHVIVGNQDLSQDDRALRNVSLVVTTDQNGIPDYRFFRVRFTFPETNLIDWTLLSEVQLCGVAGEGVCVGVCVGVYVCVCVLFACMRLHMYVCMCVCVCVWVCMCVCVHMCMYLCVCACACACVCVCVCVCAHSCVSSC